MLVLLAIAAGCVDAACFLGLGQVLTAAMTGNTVLLGLALGQANIFQAIGASIALAGFVLGAILGALIVEGDPKRTLWPRTVSIVFVFEFIVLVVIAAGWQLAGKDLGSDALHLYPLIGLAGLAMGLQSVAVQRLSVPGIATTYVTGTLTSLAVRLVGWIRSSPAAPATTSQHGSQSLSRPTLAWAPGLPALVWVAYGFGAAAAGAAKHWWYPEAFPPNIADLAIEVLWPTVALMIPITIIAVVVAVPTIRYRRQPE